MIDRCIRQAQQILLTLGPTPLSVYGLVEVGEGARAGKTRAEGCRLKWWSQLHRRIPKPWQPENKDKEKIIS